ncbi:uncharacterized protein K444DRAFT_619768 [Hyaloscypha bicolor E]|uniref:Uncharacterized protein n=1 Tax=Hyaloscypha bicolor E TaxID=1095630 RepID=A0A2J6SQP4_9HELO|nr:uncharacterized protein K444DRAFT_619768 [Hyaloscypha bicolor E]PMD53101.1 hypothetical protein K444DRAFT_619768 [Hyaloscypha bicolor E]
MAALRDASPLLPVPSLAVPSNPLLPPVELSLPSRGPPEAPFRPATPSCGSPYPTLKSAELPPSRRSSRLSLARQLHPNPVFAVRHRFIYLVPKFSFLALTRTSPLPLTPVPLPPSHPFL